MVGTKVLQDKEQRGNRDCFDGFSGFGGDDGFGRVDYPPPLLKIPLLGFSMKNRPPPFLVPRTAPSPPPIRKNQNIRNVHQETR